MSAPEIVEVVVTAASLDDMMRITRTLVDERLVACGQHLSPIRSIYRWDGAVQDEREARVALHTRASLIEQVTARVVELHPYDVPCVVALPVVGGNPAYAEWVEAETVDPGSS